MARVPVCHWPVYVVAWIHVMLFSPSIWKARYELIKMTAQWCRLVVKIGVALVRLYFKKAGF